RPAGDARADEMPLGVARMLLLELLHENRPLGARTDHRHVAAQDVEELRQLVERGAADEFADLRHARVADRREASAVLLRVGAHRAELEDLERLAAAPDPLLAVEHGAAVLERDR